MLPWLDILMGAVLAWHVLTGYWGGTRKAILRSAAYACALLLPLPFVANCTAYLRPVLEPAFKAGLEQNAVAVSVGSRKWQNLGPWQQVIGIPAGTRAEAYYERILGLFLGGMGMIILALVLIFAYMVLGGAAVGRKPAGIGALAGFCQGALVTVLAYTLLPLLALAEHGTLLSEAVESSVGFRILQPVMEKVAAFLAPFLL